eukprot:CAMPEP_0174842204 /NCGR_PEP_ID=MMETSP1114-20130205/9761_1 /TAXON_ID=312471 /ORGANISM="Neobodo designis, Strain CCAP 1951/1" /LENGTH=468 /DNA_ID=CAMNT_0016076401 /DNA_START=52 /DNA_END=1454 /DNA_ORIENTATION=-
MSTDTVSSPVETALTCDNADPTAAAAVDEADREPTREERLRMAAQMKMTCDSLSELLQYYVQQEQDLKQACAEFIVRDVEEENARIALTRRCMDEQQNTMRSAAFVKWAHENNKGDLAHGPVTAQQLAACAADDEAGEARKATPYEYHSEAADTACLDAADGTSVHPPLRMFSCPPALVQVLLAWRKGPSKAATAAIETIEDARKAIPEPTIVAVNGRVLLPCLDAEDGSADRIDFARSVGARFDTPEAAYAAWRRWALRRAAAATTEELVASASSSTIVADCLRDDGTDTLTLQPLSRFENALELRVVTIGATPIAAETPLPAVDHETIVGVKADAVIATLANTLGAEATVKSGATMRLLTVVATPGERDGPAADIAIVGSEKLTPSSVLDRWPWSDLCGVARIAREDGTRAPRTVAIRRTTHRVVDLEAGGVLPASWLPQLVAGSRPHDENAKATAVAAAPTESRR